MKLRLRNYIEPEEEPTITLKLRKTVSMSDKLREGKETLDRAESPKEVNVPGTIEPFIELWEKATDKIHGKTTKTFKEGVAGLKQLRRGTFFKDKQGLEKSTGKLSLGQWETAIDRYKKALSLGYLPAKKDFLRKSLPLFLYDSYARTEQGRSLLLHFLQHEPQRRIPEKHPKVTEALIKVFGLEHLNNKDYTPSEDDIDRFLLAANRLGEFFLRNKRKIAPHFKLTDYKKAQLLLRSVKKATSEGTVITPGYLCSNTTFDIRLPTYLKDQSIFSSVDRRRFR